MHARDFRETHVAPEPRSHVRHTNPWTQSPWDRLPNEALFLRPPRGTPNGLRGAWETAPSSLQNHGSLQNARLNEGGCQGTAVHRLRAAPATAECPLPPQVPGPQRAGQPPTSARQGPPAAPWKIEGPPAVPVGGPPGTCRADKVPRVWGARASSKSRYLATGLPRGWFGGGHLGSGTPAAAPDSRPPISPSPAPGCAGGWGGGEFPKPHSAPSSHERSGPAAPPQL